MITGSTRLDFYLPQAICGQGVGVWVGVGVGGKLQSNSPSGMYSNPATCKGVWRSLWTLFKHGSLRSSSQYKVSLLPRSPHPMTRKSPERCLVLHVRQNCAICALASLVSHCVPLNPMCMRACSDVDVWEKGCFCSTASCRF